MALAASQVASAPPPTHAQREVLPRGGSANFTDLCLSAQVHTLHSRFIVAVAVDATVFVVMSQSVAVD